MNTLTKKKEKGPLKNISPWAYFRNVMVFGLKGTGVKSLENIVL